MKEQLKTFPAKFLILFVIIAFVRLISLGGIDGIILAFVLACLWLVIDMLIKIKSENEDLKDRE